jgi:AraC-like DNA-binding protein
MEFSINLADPIEVVLHGSEPATIRGGCILGPMTRAMRVQPTRRVEIFGVCFRPGGAYSFFPYPASRLVNGCLGMDDPWGSMGSEIVNRIQGECNSPKERTDLMNRFFLRRLDDRRNNPCIAAALEVIEARKGQVDIHRLARSIGLSGRHMERCFKERVGMSPKQLCRSLRFKNVFSHLAAHPADSWVSTAVACGYGDQSHMIKDFKHYTGTSPAAYFSKPRTMDGINFRETGDFFGWRQRNSPDG